MYIYIYGKKSIDVHGGKQLCTQSYCYIQFRESVLFARSTGSCQDIGIIRGEQI